ncbi:TIGR03621 family F420-dependent LLM class oxidoreductase [Amycolatopsis benzoatilytica]|uniref:TIGR03621 family F420-dependent LLM class oxidoreductase n=1 Tax=Amycolatopsis benzoatilytica TaxID=346045 RepID=UPI00247FF63B|nr:TIGR03621 family F420-dependent LLM class oxidoreductase [Amycolatopsis benzoatilytica]
MNTPAPAPFRFGIEMLGPFPGMTWADSVRELEATGYSTVFVPDHFDEGYGPVAAMAAAATATTSLVVASAVLAADFRHPAVLARELSTIDALSGGRLEVGLGAGYQVNDYRVSGVPMAEPGVRVDRLFEQVRILRGLFQAGDRPFSFEGEHYAIDDLVLLPRPHRPAGPPILIAGGGKRMLRFAAKHADIIGINPRLPTSTRRDPRDGLAELVDEKLGWIRESAGDRIADLVFHCWVRYALVTDDGTTAAAELARALGIEAKAVRESPFVLIGSVSEIVERLHQRRERWGYSYFTVQQERAREFAPVLAALAA